MNEKKQQCRVIIHSASALSASVGAGLAQLPMSDSAVLVPIQIAMVVALGRVFGVELTESAATGLTMGAVASFFGRAVSQVMLGWIPGIGNLVNAGTAAGLTEAIGWAVVKKLEADGMSSQQV